MKRFKSILCASFLTLAISSVGMAGNGDISGRAGSRAGDISGGRAGDISGGRAGDISGGRAGDISGGALVGAIIGLLGSILP